MSWALSSVSRPGLVACAMTALFGVLALKGALVATSHAGGGGGPRQDAVAAQRADILDRNGELLVTSVQVYSLFADPRAIWNPQEVVSALAAILPDLDKPALVRRLSDRDRRFVWVKRGLTPRQRQAVFDLGLEGLGFDAELRRAYPRGSLAGHVLGYAGIDGHGLAGLEYALDDRLLSKAEPLRLTLDSGVQFALEAELTAAAERYQVQGAAGVVLEARTGAVRGLASWPAMDPNRPPLTSRTEALNRAVGAVFELGSVFKPLTVAAALESGAIGPGETFNLAAPLVVQGFEIRDTHPITGRAGVVDIIAESSNKGTAQIAGRLGIREHKAFLDRLGLLRRAQIELVGSAAPLAPDVWNDLAAATISYGHGLSVTPMAFATAYSAFANGGEIVTPTLLEERLGERTPERAMSAHTADLVRGMLRAAVTHGTGSRADVSGYRVAGKTGTAEKPVAGGYAADRNLTSFAALFPADSPEYVVLIVLDEPQKSAHNGVTAAWNAAPTAGRVIERIAPLLGVTPVFSAEDRSGGPVVRSVSERRSL